MKSISELHQEALSILKETRKLYPEELSNVYFTWSRRMKKSAGKALFVKKVHETTFRATGEVRLSEDIFGRFENQKGFRNTVLHELAHVIAGAENGHNFLWETIAHSIGCDGKRCHTFETAPTRRKKKVPARCDKCGMNFQLGITRANRIRRGTSSYRHQGCGKIVLD